MLRRPIFMLWALFWSVRCVWLRHPCMFVCVILDVVCPASATYNYCTSKQQPPLGLGICCLSPCCLGLLLFTSYALLQLVLILDMFLVVFSWLVMWVGVPVPLPVVSFPFVLWY